MILCGDGMAYAVMAFAYCSRLFFNENLLGGDFLKKIFRALVIVLMAFAFAAPGALASDTVVVVELSGEIDHGQTALVLRGLEQAEKTGAKAFVLQMDTFGGLVAAATSIRDKVIDSPVPTVCYIKNRAWSAGALIALAHEKIVIAPGGSIGAAEPIPTTEKTIAAVKAEFAATAKRTGRDPQIAEAMVDKTLGYKTYAQKGQILALTDYQAVEVGYADFVAKDRAELLKSIGFENAKVNVISQNWQEKAIGILENPAVKSGLLSIIILAIIVEVKTAGTGIGAMVAIIGAALLYGVSFMGGLTGWIEPLLFLLGVILLLIEFFMPGFGVFGIAGIISIVASFFMLLGGNEKAVIWLAASFVMSIALFLLFLRKLPASAFWNRFVLKNTSSKQEGFSTGPDYEQYMGHEGITVTQLRPGGTAEIDGQKFDVLTYGEFVEPKAKIVVIKVEGSKIFVKPI